MTTETTIRNQVVEIDGQSWKIREAVSMEAARDAINTARCTGSVGARHNRDERACGGSLFVEADVVRLNEDGSERQPYGGNPPPFPPAPAHHALDTAELKRGVLATTAGDQVHELHAPLQVTEEAHKFGDARDAIDAVSRFEAATAEFWEYAIEARGFDAWVVKVNRIDGKPLRGFLSPIA